MFKKEELSILWPFYLSIIFNINLTGAYMILYFMKFDFSFFQISFLISLAYLTAVIFDIPTGAVADVYGRKVSVLISYFATAFLFFLIPFIDSYYGFFILFLLMGVSSTLMSGADQAWIVSLLKGKKKPKLIQEYYTKSHSLHSAVGVIGPLLAALVIKYLDMKYLFTFHAITMFAGALVLSFGHETFKRKKVTLREAFQKTWNNSKKSFSLSAKHPVLKYIIIAVLFLWIMARGVSLLWQPYLKTFNIPLELFGYFLALQSLLAISIPFIAVWISKKFSKKASYLFVVCFFTSIFLILTYYVQSVLASMALLILLLLSLKFIMPIQNPYFQKFVPEKIRATITSFKTTVGTLGAGISLLIVGAMADILGPKSVLALLSVFMIPVLIAYLKIRESKVKGFKSFKKK